MHGRPRPHRALALPPRPDTPLPLPSRAQRRTPTGGRCSATARRSRAPATAARRARRYVAIPTPPPPMLRSHSRPLLLSCALPASLPRLTHTSPASPRSSRPPLASPTREPAAARAPLARHCDRVCALGSLSARAHARALGGAASQRGCTHPCAPCHTLWRSLRDASSPAPRRSCTHDLTLAAHALAAHCAPAAHVARALTASNMSAPVAGRCARGSGEVFGKGSAHVRK